MISLNRIASRIALIIGMTLAVALMPALAEGMTLERPDGVTDDDWQSLGAAVQATFGLQAKLTAQDAPGARFGQAVSIQGNLALIGAPNERVDGAVNRGAAYAFIRGNSGWRLQRRIVANNGQAGDLFGTSVSLSASPIAAIGAPGRTVSGNVGQGATYMFSQISGSWTQRAMLTASDGLAGDQFGTAVSTDSSIVIIGAPRHRVGANNQQGAAYVFIRPSDFNWGQLSKLTAGDGAANDLFGMAVSLSGDSVLVGAPQHAIGVNTRQGAAYVFVRNVSNVTQQAKLVATQGRLEDFFANTLVLEGDRALIGAHRHDLNPGGINQDQGAAFVFERSGSSWTQTARLSAVNPELNENFGVTVALSGNQALIGAASTLNGSFLQGSAYVFGFDALGWVQRTRLVAPDGVPGDRFQVAGLSGPNAVIGAFEVDLGSNISQGAIYAFRESAPDQWDLDARLTAGTGEASSRFGRAVAISGDTALVGASGTTVTSAEEQGAAYVFVRINDGWSLQARLIDPAGQAFDRLGGAVALSEDTALVGTPGFNANGQNNRGAALIFVRNGATWTLQARLTASNGTADDFFGLSTSLDGDFAAVGTSLRAGGNGGVYIFERSGTEWIERPMLASPATGTSAFGSHIALSGESLVVGAPNATVNAQTQRGAAFVYLRTGSIWQLQQQLQPPFSLANLRFGSSVALFDDLAMVGATGSTAGPVPFAGEVNVYTRNAAVWTHRQILIALENATSDLFGSSLALEGDRVIIGAPGTAVGANASQGLAYSFILAGGNWIEERQLIAPDGAAFDTFGTAVATSGLTTLVGSPQDDVGATLNQGSAYVILAPDGDIIFADRFEM